MQKDAIYTMDKLDALAMDLYGKSLNRSNGERSENQYSKGQFAEKIVLKNKKWISFEGFRPVLAAIVKSIEDYDNL